MEWPALGFVDPPENSLKGTVLQAAALLKSKRELFEEDRRNIAFLLEVFARSERALEAVEPQFRSKQSPWHWRIALDYLVQLELQGKRNAARARGDVARAWSKADATVKDAFTDWRAHAERMRDELLRLFQRAGTTRAQVLAAISADVRHQWKNRSR